MAEKKKKAIKKSLVEKYAGQIDDRAKSAREAEEAARAREAAAREAEEAAKRARSEALAALDEARRERERMLIELAAAKGAAVKEVAEEATASTEKAAPVTAETEEAVVSEEPAPAEEHAVVEEPAAAGETGTELSVTGPTQVEAAASTEVIEAVSGEIVEASSAEIVEATSSEIVEANTAPAAPVRERLRGGALFSEIIRKIVFCVALGAFVYAGTGLAIYGWGYYSSGKEYRDMEEEGDVVIEPLPIATTAANGETQPVETIPAETETDENGESHVVRPARDVVPRIKFSVDEEYFKSVNSDYVCYLYIPGASDDTSIKYPVVLGEDNEHYLRYTYRNTENMAGAICFDFRTKRDDPLGSFNSVIWGHDRKDGSMFGGLLRYKDYIYGGTYKYIYIYMRGEIYVYEIFSFFRSTPYGPYFSPTSKPADIIEKITEMNQYKNGVTITEEDKILTLYTCTEDAVDRYILSAILRDRYTP